MTLTPRKLEKHSQPGDERRNKVPWVSWIAIFLGVGMTALGIILLLWGFAWQTDVGEPQNINGDEFKGGPCLIPMGGAILVIGLMWVLTGWRGFKKDQTHDDMQKCPNCGKMIESDLNFCYYCNTTFEDEEKVDDSSKRTKGPGPKPEREENEGMKKARPLSPEEKR